jgi:F-type H+-transporting ATPase subunit b
MLRPLRPAFRDFAAMLIGAVLCVPAAARAQGMPQLNFSNPLTVDQVAWGAAIFVIFFLLCWKWGLPLVANVLDERSATIAADLDRARGGKAQADAAADEMTRTVAKARADAQGAINAAVDAAKRDAAARSAELDQRLETQLREAESRIAEARGAAMRALRQVAAETASSMIVRLTGNPADPARIEGAIGVAIAARGEL